MDITLKRNSRLRGREKRKGFRGSLRKNGVSYLMLLPYALIFFVFIILPVLASIALSFTNFNMLQMPFAMLPMVAVMFVQFK